MNSTEAGLIKGRRLLLLISFIEGGAVMAVELLGAKMIEPYFGSSLYVWSSVLAVTILGLTLGYYLGGRTSLGSSSRTRIFLLLQIAALFVILMPITGPMLMESILFVETKMAAIISSLFILFPIMICLGMISPLVIKELSEELEETGVQTGLVFTFSTLGGVIITLLTGFFLIPEIGLRLSTVAVSTALIIMPLYDMAKTRQFSSRLIYIGAIILFIGVNVRIHTKEFKRSEHFKVQHLSDGLMGQIMVIDYLKQKTRILYTNNISQSLVYLPTGRSQFLYVHRIATYSSFKPEESRVLVAGVGAGLMINEFDILGFEVDAIDIDKRMAEVATEYFNMTNNVNIITDDFRHGLKTSNKSYDIIALDVSAGENQPSHLYTVESFKEMKAHLGEDGVLFIHYPTIYQHEEGLALKSIGRTLKEAGFHVELINTGGNFTAVQEFIYFASVDGTSLAHQDFSRRDTFAIPYNIPIYEGIIYPRMSFDEGYILTDDQPMMELLHNGLAETYRVNMKPTIKSFLSEGIRMY